MEQDTRVAVIALTQFTGRLLARVEALEAMLIQDQIVSAGQIRDARRQTERSVVVPIGKSRSLLSASK
jgi:hypothetical protein